MNNPKDDERWAPGRETIEREKDAARIWLARRDWKVPGSGRETPPLRRPARPARWAAAAAGIAVLFLGFLLLRPLFHSRASFAPGFTDAVAKVFERVQAEGAPHSPQPGLLDEIFTSEAAWSIQRVFCAAALEDAFEGGLPHLIEKALELSRRDGEAGAEETAPKAPRRSDLTELLLRFYQSIKEG